MIGFLRFVGIANVAVWFGAAVSFTVAGGPGFFSDEMKQLLPAPYNGAAAEIIIKRYFVLQHWCGAIALLHLLTERLYTGKAVEKLSLAIVTVIFCWGLAAGFWLQPKMHHLHLAKYRASTPELREQAAKSFKSWHAVAQSANLAVIFGLLFYLWRITSPANSSRLPPFRKLSVGWE